LVERFRRFSQTIATVLPNAYLKGFIIGGIYQGSLKQVCHPGFNCYSCPSALLSCPIGAIQFMVAYGSYHFSFYTLGLLGIIGSIGGRIVCGWACPFGFLQDLFYKVKLPKKEMPRWLDNIKYLVLVVLVFIIPYLTLEPWFSKLCPMGTLEAGIPLLMLNPKLRPSQGWFFVLKIAILLFFLCWTMVTVRPFCRTTCPLGAIYSLFNSISYFRLKVDEEKCNKCNLCIQDCPVSLSLDEIKRNAGGCVRCLRCTTACTQGAITFGKGLTNRA
jgi:polyferredoxin